jgi:transposase
VLAARVCYSAPGPDADRRRNALRRLVATGSDPGAKLHALLARRPAKVAAIALANKMARIAWALLTKGGIFARKGTTNEHAMA